jgi:hypothetical protein
MSGSRFPGRCPGLSCAAPSGRIPKPRNIKTRKRGESRRQTLPFGGGAPARGQGPPRSRVLMLRRWRQAGRKLQNDQILLQRRPFLVPTLCVGMPSSTLCVVFRFARRSHGGQHPKIRGSPRWDCAATQSVEDGIPTEDRGNEVSRCVDHQAGLMRS